MNENFIFGLHMNLNSYIAIFFTVIFFGKFLVMDSKILVTILDTGEITYVNPFCEKQNSKISDFNDREFLAEAGKHTNLALDTFCNSPFQVEIFNWEQSLIPQESRAYPYRTSIVPEAGNDRFYPPPKV